MKTFTAISLAPVILAFGCASSTTRATAPAEPRSGLTVDLVASDDTAEATFPARISSPTTPRAANLLASRVVAELGGEARAALKLCVDGRGRVSKADVASSSGMTELDQVFVEEARTWRYQPLAVDDASVCRQVDIEYRVVR